MADYTPERVEEITGIPAEDMATAARIFATAERRAILYAMGITQHTTGVDNVMSCANLAMLTGNVGKPGGGVNPLRGQNNVQGACDLGGLPNVYSGYQPVTIAAVQEKFEEAWGVRPAGPAGPDRHRDAGRSRKGDLTRLYVLGENPMVSDPDLNHVRQPWSSCEFLVVQDIFPHRDSQLADVILPGASFVEKEGTFTNTERRMQLVRQAIQPPGESRPDWAIIAELAKRMAGCRTRCSLCGLGP